VQAAWPLAGTFDGGWRGLRWFELIDMYNVLFFFRWCGGYHRQGFGQVRPGGEYEGHRVGAMGLASGLCQIGTSHCWTG